MKNLILELDLIDNFYETDINKRKNVHAVTRMRIDDRIRKNNQATRDSGRHKLQLCDSTVRFVGHALSSGQKYST